MTLEDHKRVSFYFFLDGNLELSRMTTDPDPKYKNGIPVRTIGGDDSTHLEDFLEETEGRRGFFTDKTDGFCLR